MRPLIPGLFGLGSGRLRVALGVAMIASLALLGGCEAETPPGSGPSSAGGSTGDGGGGAGGSTGTSTGAGRCEDGEIRRCEVQLPTHRNVTSCFKGVQICAEGEWGPCTDPPASGPPPPTDSLDEA